MLVDVKTIFFFFFFALQLIIQVLKISFDEIFSLTLMLASERCVNFRFFLTFSWRSYGHSKMAFQSLLPVRL